MSQQHVDVVRKAVDALNRQDADAFVASAHPDVEWEATDDRFPGFRALYRGRTGVRRWFEEAVERGRFTTKLRKPPRWRMTESYSIS
jgi:ketosteroid isomerase-like protein